MNDKSVVYLVNWLAYGGAEVQVSRLAAGMIQRGWRVDVISMIREGTLAETLKQAGAGVHYLDMRPGIPNPGAILRLRRLILGLKPAVVHSHIVHANLLARVTRLIARMPVLVCTAHNVQECGRALELGYRYTDGLADLTTNVSQAAVDRYIRIGAAPANRIRFVPNGLDVSLYRNDPARRDAKRNELGVGDRFVWLAIGRMHEQKDYPNLLKAFAAAGLAKDSTLLIVGTGPLQASLEQLAASLGVGDSVRFLGTRNDVPALMNMADGYVMSSAWEGMPLVLQEAGASALPIVATRVGGNAEVALDGQSAWIIPPGDTPALADAMRRMTDLPAADRHHMGVAGRAHVTKNYDMPAVLDQWEDIYDELRRKKRLKNLKFEIADLKSEI